MSRSKFPPLRLLPLMVAMGTSAVFSAQAQSLTALYEAARNYDATYQSAKSSYEATVAKAAQSKALWLPTVGLQAGLQRRSVASSTSADTLTTSAAGTITANSISNTTTDTGQTDRTLGLTLQQNLFNRANDHTISQAERNLEIASLALGAAEQDLAIRVSQTYFDVLAAEDTLQFVAAQKSAVSEQLASAKRNFEVGTSTITDTREAQARFDLVIAQELAADNDLQVKRSNLAQLVGKQDARPNPLKAPVVIDPLADDMQTWVTRSEQSPAVLIKTATLAIARLETSKANAGHLPTVALSAGYTRTMPSGTTSSVTNAFSASTGAFAANTLGNTYPGDNTATSIGVSMTLPLFAGFAVQNRVKETLALESQAESDLDAAKRTAAQATRTAYFGVQSGLAQVKALEAAEASSQSALDANKLGYQVGVRINIDVLNSQSQLYDTKAKLSKARYDVLVGGLKLRQASGVLKVEDLQSINERLVN